MKYPFQSCFHCLFKFQNNAKVCTFFSLTAAEDGNNKNYITCTICKDLVGLVDNAILGNSTIGQVSCKTWEITHNFSLYQRSVTNKRNQNYSYVCIPYTRHHNPFLIRNRSWILPIHKNKISGLQKWSKNLEAAAYNGAHTKYSHWSIDQYL